MQRPSPDADRPHMSCWRQLGSTVAVLFIVAVLANYLWELAQAPLYVGMESFRVVWWHCFVASLGDGLLVLGIFVTGWGGAASAHVVHAPRRGRLWPYDAHWSGHWDNHRVGGSAYLRTMDVHRLDAPRTRARDRARARSANACAPTSHLSPRGEVVWLGA